MSKRRPKYRGPMALVPIKPLDPPLDFDSVANVALRFMLGDSGIMSCISAKTSFIAPECAKNTSRWLFIYVPSVSNEDMRRLETATELYGEPVPVVLASRRYRIESPLIGFGRCSLTKSGRKKFFGNRPDSALTLADLVHNEHLLGYMSYPKTGLRLAKRPGTGAAFALDCEMCLAGDKSVLTRIAVVDFDSEAVLLDTLVKPAEPITDYVTMFSGITAEMLEGVTTTLQDVQSWLCEHVGATDVLIGHSLDNDLRVLEIAHDRLADTSLLYPHDSGLPMRSGLKYLAKKFLNEEIQGPATAENLGHDPTEDAMTCVKLVKLKLEHGMDFGDTSGTVPLTRLLSECGLKSTIVDRGVPHWDANGTADVISVTHDAEAVEKALKALEKSAFVFTALSDPDLTKLGVSMSTLVTDAPPNTAVMIWNGVGDTTRVFELQAKRRQSNREYKTKKWDEIKDPWTDADSQELASADNKARTGTAFITVKIADESGGIISLKASPEVYQLNKKTGNGGGDGGVENGNVKEQPAKDDKPPQNATTHA